MHSPATAQPLRQLRRWLARGVATLGLLLLTFAALPHSNLLAQPRQSAEDNLRDARQRWQDLSTRLELLRARRQKQENRYDALTHRIAEAKRGNQKPLGGLDSLLADARTLADELNALQEELRQVEGYLEFSRQEILGAYQDRIQQLERAILTAPGAEDRKRAIEAINTLKKERFAWSNPNAPTPDLNLQNLPSLKSLEGADPDEMQAVAAELDDNERRLRTHIKELEDNLGRLERERRLRQRAADFNEEEAFFDETSRNRRIARTQTRVIGGNSDSAGSDKPASGASGGDALGTPPTDDQSGAGGVESDVDNAESPGNSDPSVGGAPDRGDNGFGTAAPNPNEPGVGAPEQLPSSSGGAPDPFATPGVIVRADVQMDGINAPGRAAGDESLEARMTRLKRDKARMEQQAEELRRRSRELKRRAHEL